jgi:hypothetical protein
MLYREIIAVCSEIHTKHINTLRGQNVEFANVKPGGTYSNHWALEGLLQAVVIWNDVNIVPINRDMLVCATDIPKCTVLESAADEMYDTQLRCLCAVCGTTPTDTACTAERLVCLHVFVHASWCYSVFARVVRTYVWWYSVLACFRA